jgi:hypothetical protein
MKSNKTPFVLAILLSTLVSLSGATVYSMDNDSNCLAQMKEGKYKGQCMDTSMKRAVKILAENPANGKILIANFRKGGKFYQASIPLNEVESVSYIVVDLKNLLRFVSIAHVELRFKMRPGSQVLLADSAAGIADTETDFMMSFNYMAPKGVEYDPVKGFNNTLYGSVLQIFSTQDEIQNRYVNHKINMYEVPLDTANGKAGRILRGGLVMSDKIQYDVAYDTWTTNCATFLFDMIDQGLQLNIKPFRFKAYTFTDTSLIPAMQALANRQLIDDQTTVRLLNTEFKTPQFPSASNPYFNFWTGKTWSQIKQRQAPPQDAGG